MASWFPRPQTLDDLRLLTSSALSPAYFYGLLTHPEAQEWRDKVGVYGLQDGSGKTTARLLCHQNWVFKTDRSQATTDLPVLTQVHQHHQEQALTLGVYHPDKHWLLLREGDHWLPVTACPRLYTLRTRADIVTRVAGWLAMYQMGARLLRNRGIELDLNPANFGSLPGDEQLWYIDDEWYPAQTGLSALGLSLAHRMAESEDLSLVDWQQLGIDLYQTLHQLGCEPLALRSLQESLAEYPLRGTAVAARHRFLQQLSVRPSVKTARKPRRVAILADIHANLPALEAVLATTADIGVTEYVLLGDVVGYGPHPEACVERVAQLPLLAAVRGNHDQAVVSGEPELGMRPMAQASLVWTQTQLSVASKAWLGALPTFWRQGPIMAVHGSLLDPQHMYGYIYDMTYEANLQAARSLGLGALFFGHSHFPVVYRQCHGFIEQRLPTQTVRLLEPGRCLLLNPGSVGQPRDRDSRAAFAIWEQTSQQVHFLRQVYPLMQTIQDIRRAGLSDMLAQRLEAGR
jgi:predicted phosphodiesterase